MLKVIRLNLEAGHLITHILKVLHITRSTYYSFLKWQKSKRVIRRDAIKNCVLEQWLNYPMYGYHRLTILLNKQFNFNVS